MKALFLAMMVAMTSVSIVQADEDPEHSIASIIVNANDFILPNTPHYLDIKIIAGSDLGDSTLKVTLDLPHGQSLPESIAFKLKRKKIRPDQHTYFKWVRLAAENYVRAEANSFTLSLPSMEGLEVAEFAIGWIGAKPHQLKADITLTSQSNEVAVKEWEDSSSARKPQLSNRQHMNCDPLNSLFDNIKNSKCR